MININTFMFGGILMDNFMMLASSELECINGGRNEGWYEIGHDIGWLAHKAANSVKSAADYCADKLSDIEFHFQPVII